MIKNNIVKLRNAQNIKQEELAEKSGISRVALSGIENGKTPNGDTMLRIAKALNKKVEEVFSEEIVTQR